MINEKFIVEKEVFTRKGKARIIKFLGKGKSGYSYLAEIEREKYVLKIMHYEPCPYYSFGDVNKVILEVGAYYKLRKFGFPLPQLFEFNTEENYLIKQYIEGKTAMDIIAENNISDTRIAQLFQMSKLAKINSINIDYFPNNFVINSDKLFYIDYEFNPYSIKWNLENWGIYYWANNVGMKEFLKCKNPLAINETEDSGIPIKDGLQSKVDDWMRKFGK